MANIKSAEKRARQAVGFNLRNRMAKSAILTMGKQFVAAVESGDKSKALQLFSRFASMLDKSVKRGIIKQNNADRRKSRAAARLAKTANA
jgi:small subunit ribosomal protein S20